MARVFISAVINAPADRVWDRIRDFNGLPKWHPKIRDSRIEDALPSDQVGCIRNFNLHNGDNIREQLLGMSDYDMSVTYSILESPMPLEDYISTIRLTPVTDGDRCFAEWSAEFGVDPAIESDWIENIGGGVFQGGLDALKRHFGG